MINYLERNNWLVWLIVGVSVVGAQLFFATLSDLGINLPLWPAVLLGAVFALVTGYKVATTRTFSAQIGRICLSALAIAAVIGGIAMNVSH